MNNKMNIVRSIKSKPIIHTYDQNYVKEIGWDDRFYLGKLPKHYDNSDIGSMLHKNKLF